MSDIRLYLDEDAFQNALVQALRNSDLDIVTVSDVNKLSYSDEEQLLTKNGVWGVGCGVSGSIKQPHPKRGRCPYIYV